MARKDTERPSRIHEREQEYSQEVKKAIIDPDYVVAGWNGELIALRYCKIAPGKPKYLSVIYRELDGGGFVITTFFIAKLHKLLRRGMIWSRPK